HPVSIHVPARVERGSLSTSLLDVANAIDEDGLSHDWSYRAAKDLLMRRPPLLVDGSSGACINPGEEPTDAAIRIAQNLDRSYLAIQGPPGSGKTYTGAHMIIALVQAGKKVGITAVSHKVIRNLSCAVLREAQKKGID